MRVRAMRRGFYGNQLRRVGDVFTLASAVDFSGRWMAQVSSALPEQRASAQQAVDVAYARGASLGARRVASAPVDTDADPPVDFDFNPFF